MPAISPLGWRLAVVDLRPRFFSPVGIGRLTRIWHPSVILGGVTPVFERVLGRFGVSGQKAIWHRLGLDTWFARIGADRAVVHR